MQRNAAINNLRGFGTFRYASLRLLDDLIEVMGADNLAPRQIDSYVDCAKKASFSLYWSLDLRYWDKKYRDNEPRYHSICLCSANGHGLQLEPLGHLLAYSIAQQFDEPAAVVSLGERQVHFWHRGGFVGPLPLPAKTDDHSIATELKTLLPEPHPPFYHLIYVHPRAAEAASKAHRFHRIVYINPEPDIAAVPSHLRGLLIEPVWDGDDARIAPKFSSFISTHFLGHTPTRAAMDGAQLDTRIRSVLGSAGLRTQPTGDIIAGTPRPAGWRLRRDACRLAMDLSTIRRAWSEWSKGSRAIPAFGEVLFEQIPSYRDSAFHWARAVTNRQVGLALSGGGASTYRMVPFIRRLHNEMAVPVDVVGGAGGGALLGAYYCTQGLEGLDTFIAQGTAFSAFVIASIFSSRMMRTKIDFDLLGARIERLETRYVPVTTVLSGGRVPEQHVVIAGTVGEAVRVSGSTPVLWSRTIMGRRHYSDGGSAMLVSARALREHGADMIIACNCVPGPADGNPVAYYLNTYAMVPLWLAEILSDNSLCGRLVDGLVAAAFLNQQASREMAEDAHVYMESNPSPLPLVESFAFYEAARLVGAAEREMRRHAANGTDARDSSSIWAHFRQSPRLRD